MTADAGNPEKKAQILITGAECRASSVPFSVLLLLLTSHPFSVPIDPPWPPQLLRVTDRPILQQNTNEDTLEQRSELLKRQEEGEEMFFSLNCTVQQKKKAQSR